ncbi:MAG: hypothetical protein JKY15_01855 [Deltaproteobacteria bacterium]|nr:hypothetical protein [Deltaproteobacteria bacterium]
MITSFDNDLLRSIGNNMLEHPENYMISPDGKLFAKCGGCPNWHPINEMNISEGGPKS